MAKNAKQGCLGCFGLIIIIAIIAGIIGAFNGGGDSKADKKSIADKTPKQAITAAVKNHLDGSSKLEKIEVNENAGKGGGYLVQARIRNDDLTEYSGQQMVRDIMEDAYKNKKIYGVTLFFDTKLIDKKGNKSIGTSMKVSTTRADKIKYKNINPSDLPDIVEQYNAIPAIK